MDFAKAKSIFAEAAALTSVAERAAHLEAVCGGDRELRQQIESWLAAQEQLGNFLQPLNSPPAEADAKVIGTRIGPYRVLEKIGEGGFGIVYLAEQEQPVRRKVALKIIKAGMDTKQVIARFEAERQALAMMDHSHIARVLGAGETEAGRPYFVMELVKGQPITGFCDREKLSVRAHVLQRSTVGLVGKSALACAIAVGRQPPLKLCDACLQARLLECSIR